jgi:hypothetical protein
MTYTNKSYTEVCITGIFIFVKFCFITFLQRSFDDLSKWAIIGFTRAFISQGQEAGSPNFCDKSDQWQVFDIRRQLADHHHVAKLHKNAIGPLIGR